MSGDFRMTTDQTQTQTQDQTQNHNIPKHCIGCPAMVPYLSSNNDEIPLCGEYVGRTCISVWELCNKQAAYILPKYYDELKQNGIMYKE